MTNRGLKGREVWLRSYPSGALSHDDFELATVDVPQPKQGEILVKNLWMSIDAGQRTLMGQKREKDLPNLPVHGFQIGKPLDGMAIGRVIESNVGHVQAGAYVMTNLGWREYCITDTRGPFFEVLDEKVAPLPSYLHVMGAYGAAAYYALTLAGSIKLGDTVLVSAAGGTVGSIACQVAKLSGCRVVGVTDSDEKVAWLTDELEIDAAINEKTVDDLQNAIAAACPAGIDVCLDSVGGKYQRAAINLMNLYGRIVQIGQLQSYDGAAPVGPDNLFLLTMKRLRLQGFSIFDHYTPVMVSKYRARMGKWLEQGKVKYRETIQTGLENAPGAQIGLFKGVNVGKMLVKLD